MNDKQRKAMFAKQKPLRKHRELSDLKRNPLAWHRDRNIKGNMAEKRRMAISDRKHKQEMHFTRCELIRPIKDGDDRGHLYAVNIDHQYNLKCAESGRTPYKCVFCGEEEKEIGGRIIALNDNKIVSDVPNNKLVRDEAMIRNIPVKYYKMNQESLDKNKFGKYGGLK